MQREGSIGVSQVDTRWDDPGKVPLSNGPFRTVTGPAKFSYIPVSDRCETEYLVPFPFHAVDLDLWPPLEFITGGNSVTIDRPINSLISHAAQGQFGNEQADAYCTIIRLSTPLSQTISTDDGWKIIKRLLEWIRVKCRHYWLLHGINGFGATYRGSVFIRDGFNLSYQNVALYGPNVLVGPLTIDLWKSMSIELESDEPVPIADSLFCDALLSIVAGDMTKALLEAGVAEEVAITQLLIDVSRSSPQTPAKANFAKNNGDRSPFGKKLMDWTKKLSLVDVEEFFLPNMAPNWSVMARELYQFRNGVAHGGKAFDNWHEAVTGMFAAGSLLEYCRSERIRLGLPCFSMPSGSTPWGQVRSAHNGNIAIRSSALTGTFT
jgi:hypothetical protein